MADSVSWESFGNAAVTQGISFLYGQAADLIRRWRDRKSGKSEDTLKVTPAPGVDQTVLAGQLQYSPIDEDALAGNMDNLLWLTERLGSYVSGIREIDSTDRELAAAAEALRGLLELAYQQRISFRGEARDVTGSAVDVTITAHHVSGKLTLARIGNVTGTAHVEIRGDIDSVDREGKVVGLDTDTIGG
jgi:hypothetical protein